MSTSRSSAPELLQVFVKVFPKTCASLLPEVVCRSNYEELAAKNRRRCCTQCVYSVLFLRMMSCGKIRVAAAIAADLIKNKNKKQK